MLARLSKIGADRNTEGRGAARRARRQINEGNERRRRWRQSLAVRNSWRWGACGQRRRLGTCRLWSFLVAVWRARRAGAGTSVGFDSRPSQQDRRRSEREGCGAGVACRSRRQIDRRNERRRYGRQRRAAGRPRVWRRTTRQGQAALSALLPSHPPCSRTRRRARPNMER